ncbi:MAG: adenosine kinase [Candidatus Coatesbacteria bacterium]|nr:adenosine kinase [Candidatus Coatesbacteria bacterium]
MKKTGILGMGNALTDILTKVDDKFLLEHGLPKGTMQLVSFDKQDEILKGISDYAVSAGGCAANTITAVANLAVETGFIGKIGNDRTGNEFKSDLEKHGVKSFLKIGRNPSGSCVSLITPDGERTFGTYLGSAIELTRDDLSEETFSPYEYFHIEGYLVQNHDLVRKAWELSKKTGTKISIDLASPNVVEDNKEFLEEVLKSGAGIIFANEEEAKAFTGKDSNLAADELSRYADIVVVKLGSKGSIVKRGSEVLKIEIIPVKPVDTTGAGDLFASGFLFGLIKGRTLKESADFGSLLAREVVQIMGTKFSEETWEKIKKTVK